MTEPLLIGHRGPTVASTGILMGDGRGGLVEIPVVHTRVVNRRKAPYDQYIGRGTIWGNPFKIGVDGTRDEVIAKYRAWIQNQPRLLARIHELKGKTLGCWCKPKACHGDVLAELADNLNKEPI